MLARRYYLMVVVLAVLGIRNASLVGLAIPGSFFMGITVLNSIGVTMNIIVLFSYSGCWHTGRWRDRHNRIC